MAVGLAAASARGVGWDVAPWALMAVDALLVGGLAFALGEWLARRLPAHRAPLVAALTLLGWYALENTLRGHPEPALLVLLVGLLPGLGFGVRGAALPALLLCFPALVTAPRASAAANKGSVVLVVMDTLRRDHMSLYGYERETTPELDRWARRGRVYTRVLAAAPHTLPSHASMFTGLYPRSHGAHLVRTPEGSELRGLHPSLETIAEIAHMSGIQTAAITANFATGANGLEQGFDTWSTPSPRTWPRFFLSDQLLHALTPNQPWYSRYPVLAEAEEIRGEAQRWLEANGDQRFFLFLNFMDVHQPTWRRDDAFLPHEPDEGDFDDLPVEEAITRLADPGAGPGLRKALNNRYDRHLRSADAELGALLTWMEDRGLLANTTVILTGDHGEYLGEEGLAFHPVGLHPPVLDVPLVIWGPGVQPGRDDRATSGVDIFLVIAEALDLHRPPRVAARPLASPGEPAVAELYAQFQPALLQPPFAERMDRAVIAARFGQRHYLRYADGFEDARDLDADPSENLCARADPFCDEAAAWVSGWQARTPRRGEETLPAP